MAFDGPLDMQSSRNLADRGARSGWSEGLGQLGGFANIWRGDIGQCLHLRLSRGGVAIRSTRAALAGECLRCHLVIYSLRYSSRRVVDPWSRFCRSEFRGVEPREGHRLVGTLPTRDLCLEVFVVDPAHLDVKEGFPEQVDLSTIVGEDRFNREELQKNLMFGTPDQVIEKLKQYRAIGVDDFIYNASYGLPRDKQKRSLKLFCEEVVPAFS
mgnify:CR=1 FL=1